MPPASAPPHGKVFVSRQAVLDRSGRVYGYELRHHDPELSDGPRHGTDEATAEILTGAILAIGLDALTNGRRAFLRVSPGLLLAGVPSTLQPDRVILELADSVEMHAPQLVRACEELRAAGYGLALEHSSSIGASPLLSTSTFVKVDFKRATSKADRARLLPDGLPAHAASIAVHVENAGQLSEAIAEGFTYFQGFISAVPSSSPEVRCLRTR